MAIWFAISSINAKHPRMYFSSVDFILVAMLLLYPEVVVLLIFDVNVC